MKRLYALCENRVIVSAPVKPSRHANPLHDTFERLYRITDSMKTRIVLWNLQRDIVQSVRDNVKPKFNPSVCEFVITPFPDIFHN